MNVKNVILKTVLYIFVIGFISLFFIAGIGAGFFASLVSNQPVPTNNELTASIYEYAETSELYFAGNTYLGDIRSEIHREETSLEEIDPEVIEAVIATEDENFFEHNGIETSSISRALLELITNAPNQTGGSTITQQLVKNQILTNEVTFERKATEMLLALRLERLMTKEEVLEAYLNVVPFGRDSSGRNIAGIETAAQGVFGISASELNLPQAAYLTGLPQSPSRYTPFTNFGGLKEESAIQPGLNRMETVLSRMLEQGFITQDEYNGALQYDVTNDFIEPQTSSVETYPYLTFELEERATTIIMNLMAAENDISREELNNNQELKDSYFQSAKQAMSENGYQIHSTIDKEIYDGFQQITSEFPYYGPDKQRTVTDPETGVTRQVSDPVQTASVLIENDTGRIISFVGGRGFNESDQINYATDTLRSSGSAFKPLLVYAPAMEKGIIQPATPFADYDRSIPVPGQSQNWEPQNYGGAHYGIVSSRRALANSYNIPTALIYTQMIEDDPASYLEKMGITSLTAMDHEILSLSLGAMTNGVTAEELTNAFATFGNNGDFVDAYMVDKITTSDGEIIYENESEPSDVFTPETNYLTVDMMRDVMTYGTATYAGNQLQNPNVDWAGKSGTSNDYHDAWFIATNPNVTLGTWMGYRTPAPLNTPGPLSYSQRNYELWAQLVNGAASIDADLITPSGNFEAPEGIVEASYCQVSGMQPSELCEAVGLVKTDIFNEKYLPQQTDDSLIYRNGSIQFNPEFLRRNGYDQLNNLEALIPRTDLSSWGRINFEASESNLN